jgi:glycosyltransferase involved in cell wall biosynthesis
LTTSPETPVVTVGMPVFNGARYIREAVESVLGQEFADLELIISDNGSTDETERICRALASSDSRVRYYREETNRGAAWNYNRVLVSARGRYFHWAASDDRFEPAYLGSCVQRLERDKAAVLAFCSARIIDGHGDSLELWAPRAGYAQQDRPSARFEDVLKHSKRCFEIFGVMRTNDLLRTQRIAPFSDSDRSLLTELAMLGKFAHVNLPLYVNREHEGDSVHTHPRRQDRARWFDPRSMARFPQWRLVGAFLRAAWHNDAPLLERLQALAALAPWMIHRRAFLIYELLSALPRPVRRAIDPITKLRRRRIATR